MHALSCRLTLACTQELYKKFMAKTPEEEPPKAFFDALGENRYAMAVCKL